MRNQHTNSENTITTLFVEILMPMSATWNIHEQTTKPLVENQGKPDAIIRTVERYPMAVEVKIDYKRGANETGEKQAREQYLDKTLAMTQEKLASAIVIRLPYRFRTMPRAEIRENLEVSNDFAYTLLNVDEPTDFRKKVGFTAALPTSQPLSVSVQHLSPKLSKPPKYWKMASTAPLLSSIVLSSTDPISAKE